MEFRWVAILALWTLLIGPVLHSPRSDHRPPGSPSVSGAGKQKHPSDPANDRSRE